MKKFISLLLVGLLGSAITIAAYRIRDNRNDTLKETNISEPPSGIAVYTADTGNAGGKAIGMEFTDAAARVMPGVVHIMSTQKITSGEQKIPDAYKDFFNQFFGPNFRYENPQEKRGPQVRVGSGSGVIINSDGYIVTNDHVIKGADDIEVTLNDNRTYKANVVGIDPSTDLALIQIKETGLSYIPFANSDNVKVGEWVLAVGNPFNLTSTVTAGIVSAKARNINILSNEYAVESFIQTDAAINPGNSGGALVNAQGGLIGINTAIASPTGTYAGYGFAVPSNIVSKVVKDLLEYGVVERGYLGAMISGINSELAREKALNTTEGVYVDSIMPNTAAQEAGLKEGDVILNVDDKEVKTAPELQEIIARHHPGDKLQLTVDRFGKKKEFTVTLKARTGEKKTVSKEYNTVLSALGADLEEIDKETARQLDINGGVKVVKLYAGKLRRQTEIKEGFIITQIDHHPVKTVDDVVKILENKKGGVLLEGVYEGYPGEYYYAMGL